MLEHAVEHASGVSIFSTFSSAPIARTARASTLSLNAGTGEKVHPGRLICPSCRTDIPIVGGIARFVSGEENYGEYFAYEWSIKVGGRIAYNFYEIDWRTRFSRLNVR